MVKKKKRIKKYNKLKSKPDAFYHSFWFTKVINKFMQQGKKTCVEKYVWTAFNYVKWKTKKKALFLLFFTLMKIRPAYGFITKRFGKEFKKIPFPLFPRRQIIIALKWFVIAIKINKFSFISLEQRIRSTLLNFVAGKRTALGKRHFVYTNALYQNRLNVRFRWK